MRHTTYEKSVLYRQMQRSQGVQKKKVDFYTQKLENFPAKLDITNRKAKKNLPPHLPIMEHNALICWSHITVILL
jgi:hypothetical protein